ncbi:MAG: helix-turn-helix domain-containing protein, partial [Bacteroidota bacterium]
LSADMQIPDYETRVAIINAHLESADQTMPEDVIYYIAKNVTSNVRELEGVTISTIAKAEIMQKPITIELAANTMRNVVDKNSNSVEVTLDEIQETVANYFGLKTAEIASRSRKKEIVTARQIAMYLASRYTDKPLKAIGANFGNRDHSTVIHAKKVVPEKAEKDEDFATSLTQLMDMIQKML